MQFCSQCWQKRLSYFPTETVLLTGWILAVDRTHFVRMVDLCCDETCLIGRMNWDCGGQNANSLIHSADKTHLSVQFIHMTNFSFCLKLRFFFKKRKRVPGLPGLLGFVDGQISDRFACILVEWLYKINLKPPQKCSRGCSKIMLDNFLLLNYLLLWQITWTAEKRIE